MAGQNAVCEQSNKVYVKCYCADTKGADSSLLLSRFLLKYRNTPVTTTGKCPAELIFRFRPTTLMDVLTSKQPSNHVNNEVTIRTKVVEKNEKVFKTFKVNEMVLYRNEFQNNIKWLKAKVIKVLSNCRYKIELLSRGSIRDCHGEQLRIFNANEFASQLPTVSCRAARNVENTTPTDDRNEEDIDTRPTTNIRASERLKNKPRVNYYETRPRANKRKRTDR